MGLLNFTIHNCSTDIMSAKHMLDGSTCALCHKVFTVLRFHIYMFLWQVSWLCQHQKQEALIGLNHIQRTWCLFCWINAAEEEEMSIKCQPIRDQEGHLCWWISLKNTYLVEDVKYLLPVTFRLNPYSGKSRVNYVPANKRSIGQLVVCCFMSSLVRFHLYYGNRFKEQSSLLLHLTLIIFTNLMYSYYILYLLVIWKDEYISLLFEKVVIIL